MQLLPQLSTRGDSLDILVFIQVREIQSAVGTQRSLVTSGGLCLRPDQPAVSGSANTAAVGDAASLLLTTHHKIN